MQTFFFFSWLYFYTKKAMNYCSRKWMYLKQTNGWLESKNVMLWKMVDNNVIITTYQSMQ